MKKSLIIFVLLLEYRQPTDIITSSFYVINSDMI